MCHAVISAYIEMKVVFLVYMMVYFLRLDIIVLLLILVSHK